MSSSARRLSVGRFATSAKTARTAKHPHHTEPPERLLDVNEAADMLSVKVSTLRQWTYQRRIPFVKLLGRAVRFRESDLRRVIEQWTRPPLRGYEGRRS